MEICDLFIYSTFEKFKDCFVTITDEMCPYYKIVIRLNPKKKKIIIPIINQCNLRKYLLICNFFTNLVYDVVSKMTVKVNRSVFE